jgi:hypothetical protein
MSEVTIFSNGGDIVPIRPDGLSELAQTLARPAQLTRRIQTSNTQTFRKIVNGQPVGKPVHGSFNAIIVSMLPSVSRTYYASTYDPSAKATLPDCWSNLGDTPEANAENRQSASCSTCKQNVVGSGTNGKGRACRFQRRIALLLENDSTGEVYQLNVPSTSLFGEGDKHTHPFEGYIKHLVNNGFSPDYVVTTISYDEDSPTMKLRFTPSRPITEEELAMVKEAQADPATKRLVQLTVAQADGATQTKAAPTPAPTPAPAPAADWGSDEEADEEQSEAAPKAKAPAKRATKKTAVEDKTDLAALVDAWAEDDGE